MNKFQGPNRSLVLILLGVLWGWNTASAYPWIPLPAHHRYLNTTMPVPGSGLQVDYRMRDWQVQAESWLQEIQQLSLSWNAGPPLRIRVDSLGPEDAVNLMELGITTDWQWEEAYVLVLAEGTATLRAQSPKGFFYATRTLLQMLESDSIRATGSLPAVMVWDFPRFAWRGMHLDVARHFWEPDKIQQYLNWMARYKMNVFHWHLTDDQGWRLEIPEFPGLTTVSAWRSATLRGRPMDVEDSLLYRHQQHGGYYTEAEVRALVRYADSLGIRVVPEIEMPGHARAALAAYPALSCRADSQGVPGHWGVFEDVFCAGNEATLEFLTQVLDHVCRIFPDSVVHLGGDECPKTRWEACPLCQQRMRSLDLPDAHALQSWFMSRMIQHLASQGKSAIGWDEILEGGLPEGAAVMSWRGTEGGKAAARAGHSVVMSPGKPCYLDHYQHDGPEEPLAIGGMNRLEDVYTYEPVPADLEPGAVVWIQGAQGNVWTEYMTSWNKVEYMVMPRMTALAEVLWSPALNRTVGRGRTYEHFRDRLRSHAGWMARQGLHFAPHGWDPTVLPERPSN